LYDEISFLFSYEFTKEMTPHATTPITSNHIRSRPAPPKTTTTTTTQDHLTGCIDYKNAQFSTPSSSLLNNSDVDNGRRFVPGALNPHSTLVVRPMTARQSGMKTDLHNEALGTKWAAFTGRCDDGIEIEATQGETQWGKR